MPEHHPGSVGEGPFGGCKLWQGDGFDYFCSFQFFRYEVCPSCDVFIGFDLCCRHLFHYGNSPGLCHVLPVIGPLYINEPVVILYKLLKPGVHLFHCYPGQNILVVIILEIERRNGFSGEEVIFDH